MKHTVSCIVKNQRGVIAKVSEAFAAKGINIESLAVAETENLEVSRATIVISGDEDTVAEAERLRPRRPEVPASRCPEAAEERLPASWAWPV